MLINLNEKIKIEATGHFTMLMVNEKTQQASQIIKLHNCIFLMVTDMKQLWS